MFRPRKPAPEWFPQGRFPSLYPILDAECVFGDQAPRSRERWTLLQALVRELAEAGVSLLQYRNKRDDDVTVSEDALAIREAVPQMKLILNDRPGLVGPTGWDGVHVGQEDLSPSAARELAGVQSIVGLSTHNDEQVIAADKEPVDYIAIGPVFATASKADPSPVIGLGGVARARDLSTKPLVAIGGITLANAPEVYDAGADSVAVISAIFRSEGCAGQAAKDFLQIFK